MDQDTRAMEKKIDACKMWTWRKLRVAWTERRTNELILQEIWKMRGDLSLLQKAIRPKMMFFGHVMRADGLEKEMMLACGEGRRRRGRPRKRWMEEIVVGTKMGLEELREVVRNRSARRMLTMTFAMINRIDGTR